MKKLLFFAVTCAAVWITSEAAAQVVQTVYPKPQVVSAKSGRTTTTIVVPAQQNAVFHEDAGVYVPPGYILVKEEHWVRNNDNLWWRYKNNPHYKIPYGDIYRVSSVRYKLVPPPTTVVVQTPRGIPARTVGTPAQPVQTTAYASAEEAMLVPTAAPTPIAVAEEPAAQVSQPAPQQQVTAQGGTTIWVQQVQPGR